MKRAILSLFFFLSLGQIGHADVIPNLAEAIQQDTECKKINHQLVAFSKQNRSLEQNLEKNEKKLSELDQIRQLKTSTLKQRHQQMQSLITAIGRLSRHGPDSLLQMSTNPDDLIRGIILMRSLLRWAYQNNLSLQSELGNCTLLRKKIDAEKSNLEATHRALQEQSKKMQTLLIRRRTLLKKEIDRRKKLAEHVKKMAEKAKNIRDLVGKISDKVQKSTPVSGLAPDTSGSYTILPVQGTIAVKFGQASPDNLDGLGVVFNCRKGSWVLTPISGQIVFAGPFRNYQNMIILRHQNRAYYTILAGLHTLSVDVGQAVDAGEPLGNMNDQASSLLYLELRHNEQTINPMQWLEGIG